MNRTVGLGTVFVILFILTGCWNRVELNELAIATATGLDRADGQWVVSYQIIVPSAMASGTGGPSAGGSQPAVHVFSIKADTIHEALNISNMESPRRVYVAHNNVIVVGQEAAKYGLKELMDYYFRNLETRETVEIAVTEGRASDLLKKLIPPEKVPGSSLDNILQRESEQVSVYPAVSIMEFALGTQSDGRGQIVPVVGLTGQNISKNKKKLESLDINKNVSTPVKISLTKAAAFKDDRLVGYLDRRESYGLAWLNKKVRSTELSFPCSAPGSPNRRATIRILEARTKFRPLKTGYHYTMQAYVDVKGFLTESACKQDLSNPDTIRGLQAMLAKKIQEDIYTGWDGVQRLGVDAVGFADKIHRKFPKQWKSIKQDWPEEFKRMELEVQVQATIRRTGQLQKTFE